MRTVLSLALLLLPAAPAPAVAIQASEPIELQHLYGPDALDFSPDLPSVRWLPGGAEYLAGSGEGTDRTWTVFDAATGASRPLHDAEALASALSTDLSLDGEEAARLALPARLNLAPDAGRFLLEAASDLFLWDPAASALTRLTRTPEPEELARFSPDGNRIAFVRDNDVFVVDLAGAELRLTTGGGPDLLHGKLDWVYQEEIYGRGNFLAHWWSPDGSRLAYLESDESDVPRFTVVDHLPTHLDLEVYAYPKAGDPNPRVRIGVVPTAGGDTVWMRPTGYGTQEMLIVDVAFGPDGDLWFQMQDRTQTFLDLHRADPRTGETMRVLREDAGPWTNNLGPPRFLTDGGFLWLSERTGFAHLYRYDAAGELVGALTEGEFEVRRFHAVDEDAGAAWVSGTLRTSLGSDTLRVALDGSGVLRLDEASGTHQAMFPEEAPVNRFVRVSSGLDSPPRMTLRDASDGSELRFLGGGEVPALGQFDISPPELLQVEARDGVALEAMLIRPHGFEVGREYPAWVHVYGGPHAPQVRNRWGGARGMWFQFLAQQGIVVFVVDNRIASGKGVRSTWPVYGNFGDQELNDLVDAVDWLGAQDFVDAARIGVDGWSFGGYMTLTALTKSDRFAAGIAGGSVVDWRDYDSVYTERYMSTPDENPAGYEKSSVRPYADQLHGELLMIHGTMDDNVHMQNTLQFTHDLQKAGKPFSLMLYPSQRHGVRDPAQTLHLRRTMSDFILRTMTP